MNAERTDFYAILGIPPHATQAEIGHAYRALLRRHHPDTRAPDHQSNDAISDEKLQQVLAAYAVLGDPAQRFDYDRKATTAHTPAPQRTRAAQTTYRPYGQPSIVAGPVRWHHVAKPSP